MKKLLVRIDWADDGDWPWFWLLGVEGHMVHLQGADYPDGSAQHEGDSFWVPDARIVAMHDEDGSARCAACGGRNMRHMMNGTLEYTECATCGSEYATAAQARRNKLRGAER